MDKQAIDNRIVEFINEHHVMTFSSYSGGELWTAHVFYKYLSDTNSIVFTSDIKTRHMQLAIQEDSLVVGAIALETDTVGLIRGLQFKGSIKKAADSEEGAAKYRLSYLKKYPYAVVILADLWVLTITELKFTDNRLGFGKKLLWP